MLFLLDATQSVGPLPVDVDAIGCDLLTGTGRKFLRGPRGTGFLWARTAALERLDPFVVEIGSASWDGGRGFTWAGGAQRFESREKSYVNIVGLGAAVRQARQLGSGAIGARTAMLGARLRGHLAALPGVSVHDLGEVRCAIVTASVEGVPAAEVGAALGQAGANVSATSERLKDYGFGTPKTSVTACRAGIGRNKPAHPDGARRLDHPDGDRRP